MELTREQRERLERLAAMPEEEIDTTDIPEVRDWSGAIRGGFGSSDEAAVLIRLDPDVLAWIEEHVRNDKNYQEEINSVLRQHIQRLSNHHE